MNCRQEGKLLARAGGSFITLGAERIKEPGSFALKSRRIVRLISIFRFAPIRVREKRMNTHMTAKNTESYQKVSA
jgi:hypothetical protein